MIKKMKNKDLYPLINQFVINNPDIKKLKYLPAFNEFTNYITNYYSFKITREEARNKVLENEDIIKEKDFNIKYNNFIEAWDNIKSEAIKYKCGNEMEVKTGFSKNETLINYLNDCSELRGGTYLASACQNFIEWQNSFLNPVIEKNKNGGILYNYVNKIKRIPLQKAKPEQIVLIEERFKKNKNYIDFNDIIYTFSQRNIFDDNGNINYSNYNSFFYDYDKIEEELGKILLPEVCLFKNEEELNFVKYRDEVFRGNNTTIISDFYSEYPQIDLDTNEKQEIINYINKMNKTSENNKYDFRNIFSSMQMLLFYLIEQKGIKVDETICNIINNEINDLKLSKDCIHFFNNEGKNLTIKKMMSLFFFFEHLCFEFLCESLSPMYKTLIPEDTKNKIIEQLLNKNNSEERKEVKDLASATRRLISRYLVGQTRNIDFNENIDLAILLTKEEFWDEKMRNSEDYLSELVFGKIGEFKLKVGQAYEFYNIIGEEDRNSLNMENIK